MAEPSCPICRAPSVSDRARNPYAPFCSRRCKTIDLGRWLGEGYRIPADEGAQGDDEIARSSAVPPRRQG